MDNFRHLQHEMNAENLHNGTQEPTPPQMAPPPYEDSDSDDEDSDDDPSQLPIKLLINAASVIEGSNNVVPISPTPLQDATKFSAMLLAAIKHINIASQAARFGPVKIELTINCGITIHGDKNMIGHMKPQVPNPIVAAPVGQTATPEPSPVTLAPAVELAPTVEGAKRKAEDSPDPEAEPAAKKFASEDVEME